MKVNWEKEWQKKLILPEKLKTWADGIRKEKKTIVTLNGSFDLLHSGHLFIIFEASKQADVLIVALNSDTSIQKYKNPNRPIFPLNERLQMIAALGFVSYVTYFEEVDPRELLLKIKPNVHVNGREYGENCIEKEVLDSMNSKLYLVDRIGNNLSTTKLLERIKTCD